MVRKPGSAIGEQEVLAHLAGHVARWWLPVVVMFVDELPHTATAKLLKTALREAYRDFRLEVA